jgi:hypothetical protein
LKSSTSLSVPATVRHWGRRWFSTATLPVAAVAHHLLNRRSGPFDHRQDVCTTTAATRSLLSTLEIWRGSRPVESV